MDRRTALATARSTAHRIGTLSSKVAIRMGREVTQWLAARRARADVAPPQPSGTASSGLRPGAEPEAAAGTQRSVPSPADVARVVQRNAAGLSRATPRPRRPPRPASSPGAKLPARAGHGILGV